MQYEGVTQTVIGCAYNVYNTMGFGFLESVYEKCLLIELAKAGLRAEAQRRIDVHYEGECVGKFQADVVVEDKIILELKSVQQLATKHEVQLVNYLTATRMDVGLLLNFGPDKFEIKRKVRNIVEPHIGE